MKRLNFMLAGIIASALVLVLLSCTKSPLGENKVSGETTSITGKVMLDTNIVAKNALIWLEGLNVSTNADENGEFKLDLPPALSQGGAGGYTGTLNLYFYVGNFKLGKQAVALQDGHFIYNSGPLDKNGKLKSDVILKKLLDIDIDLQPQTLIYGSDPQIRITVTLTALQDSVSVYFPGVAEGVIGPIIIVDQETGNNFAVQTTLVGVTSGPETKTMEAADSMRRTYLLGAGYFENKTAGYELIPYFLLRHETIPDGLYTDPDGGSFTALANYWKLPFDRGESVLQVQKSN